MIFFMEKSNEVAGLYITVLIINMYLLMVFTFPYSTPLTLAFQEGIPGLVTMTMAGILFQTSAYGLHTKLVVAS